MIDLNDDSVIYAFARDIEPALTIDSGETVRIRTQDCFANQIQSPEDEMDNLDWDRVNPATGPIFVKGAVVGGSLKVEIDSIELGSQTASCTGEDEGTCGDLFDRWYTKICKVEGDDLIWSDSLKIPLAPMIGVIGVAPKDEPVNCGTPGAHGGNMDNTEIAAGTTLYFPVAAEGALFGLGDLHAVMGDGEVSVSGAEVAGHVTVRLTAMPELSVADPIIETPTHLGIISSAPSLDEAADRAVHEMVELIASRTDMSEADIVMLLSLVADVRICQIVDPAKTVRFMVPNYVLDAIGFSL